MRRAAEAIQRWLTTNLRRSGTFTSDGVVKAAWATPAVLEEVPFAALIPTPHRCQVCRRTATYVARMPRYCFHDGYRVRMVAQVRSTKYLTVAGLLASLVVVLLGCAPRTCRVLTTADGGVLRVCPRVRGFDCRDALTGRFVPCPAELVPVGVLVTEDERYYCRDAAGVLWPSDGECD